MSGALLINLAYVVASALFIFGLKLLGSPASARRGNLISAVGMLIAVVAALTDKLGYIPEIPGSAGPKA